MTYDPATASDIPVSSARFYQAVYDAAAESHERYNIGTYREKKLHLILKRYFEPDTSYHEIPCAGFIADILRDGHITEIEAHSLTGLHEKLDAYLPEYTVDLVYPLAANRFVTWIDPETGKMSQKRRSPKKATVYDAIAECIRLRDYLSRPGLRILAVFLDIEEYRLLDGWSRDHKRGSHRYERIPQELRRIIVLDARDSYARFIPEHCPDPCTVREFASAAGIHRDCARTVLHVMEAVGAMEGCGKRGRELLFRRVQSVTKTETLL